MQIWMTVLVYLALLGYLGAANSFEPAMLGLDENWEYSDVSEIAWRHYEEDDRYSAKILTDYINRNITMKDAMLELSSVYGMASKTVDMLSQLEPPEDYADYHNYTLNSLLYLTEYLWDAAKYYETGDVNYINLAQSNYNMSIQYHELALDEAFFLD